ncbi:MAG TPA: SRPBCC family protein [Panacibacter sp.]|nr:SRPBCC family protein [Panacibacter sp.]
METQNKTIITVQNTVNAPAAKVWDYWTKPEHITKWNHASDEWHTPHAENDLRAGGSFASRMEAKDGSFGFDFGGVYDAVRNYEYIEYTLGDGRNVKITFTAQGNATKVVESFEAEGENSIELQQGGWQAILDNFKKYTEAN